MFDLCSDDVQHVLVAHHEADVAARRGGGGRRRIGRRMAFAVLAFGMLTPVAVAVADPNHPDIHRHRHFIQLPSGGTVEVGPRLCDDPKLRGAFNQFHVNVHNAAPGLHDHRGADVTATEC